MLVNICASSEQLRITVCHNILYSIQFISTLNYFSTITLKIASRMYPSVSTTLLSGNCTTTKTTVTQQHKQHPFFSCESNSRMTKVCLCQNHLTIILNHHHGHQPLCCDCKKDSKVTDNHLFATSKSYWLVIF